MCVVQSGVAVQVPNATPRRCMVRTSQRTTTTAQETQERETTQRAHTPSLGCCCAALIERAPCRQRGTRGRLVAGAATASFAVLGVGHLPAQVLVVCCVLVAAVAGHAGTVCAEGCAVSLVLIGVLSLGKVVVGVFQIALRARSGHAAGRHVGGLVQLAVAAHADAVAGAPGGHAVPVSQLVCLGLAGPRVLDSCVALVGLGRGAVA
jgi:hypothetical protein